MSRQTTNTSPRCQHRTRSGRLCRMDAVGDSKFCTRHASVRADSVEDDLTATLTSGLEKFNSPAAVNDFLSRLLLLLSQDRISPRRAAVLAYITNQILRSVYAMEAEAERNKEPANIEYVIECPRPDYDQPVEPGQAPSP